MSAIHQARDSMSKVKVFKKAREIPGLSLDPLSLPKNRARTELRIHELSPEGWRLLLCKRVNIMLSLPSYVTHLLIGPVKFVLPS